MARELLITADDFGVHDVIDNGIINCIKTSSIDCVDVFVTHHSSKRRIRKLLNDHEEKFADGSLKLGLHLSLTCGSPVYRSDKSYLKAISKNKTINNVKRQIFKHETGKSIICNVDDLETEYLDSLRKEMKAQFDKYIEITGKHPDHISCHAGVFHLTKSLYNIYSSFASGKNIPMRCPIFITMAKDDWDDNPEPKMLTDFQEAFIDVAEHFSSNVNNVKTWTENGLQPAFAKDLSRGLNSTRYFIEHFYRQGSVEIFRQIVDKIDEGTHEIVVHPVSYNKRKEYRTMVDGIKRRALKGRRDEMLTLSNHLNVREELASRGIIKYQLP